MYIIPTCVHMLWQNCLLRRLAKLYPYKIITYVVHKGATFTGILEHSMALYTMYVVQIPFNTRSTSGHL